MTKCCSLSAVPTGVLSHVASFLAMPSRALFAVALKNSMDNDNNDEDAAIITSILDNRNINVIDFGDIDKSLASKLSDTNIKDVMECIDAVNNLKRLRLTGCINITGAGLTPLRGSLVIEKIDLTLVRDTEDPNLHPEPMISCNDVLPILDSIIEREGRALKLLLFPKVWRKAGSNYFHAFLNRYNTMLESDAITCVECECDLPDGASGLMYNNLGCPFYGTQMHTCTVCMDNYCLDCTDQDTGHDSIGKPCKKCQRCYCSKCKVGDWCDVCEKWCCEDCARVHICRVCDKDICEDCKYSGYCEKCEDFFCEDCKFTAFCNKCNGSFCDDCHIGHCDKCNNFFCGDCKFTGFCVKCKESFCEDCKITGCCVKCKNFFCDDCKFTCFCDKCKESFCEDCKMVAFCGKCKDPFCEDCKYTGYCSKCKEFFCEDCKITGFCSKCKECFCEDCKFTVVCGVCNDWFCEDCKSTWWCDECDEFHCDDCAHEL